jgi:hypothetical protein
METEPFEFYIHHLGEKVLCRIEPNGDDFETYFNGKYQTKIKFDQHGHCYQLGGEKLETITMQAIEDGIESHLL